jgi:hypothetical protein
MGKAAMRVRMPAKRAPKATLVDAVVAAAPPLPVANTTTTVAIPSAPPVLPLPANTVASGHSTLTSQKRRHNWYIVALRAPFRAVCWVVDCIDDRGDPSLVKLLALGFGVLAMYDMRKGGVAAANTTLAGLCICAAFGRSMMMAWLNRFTWTNATSSTTTRSTNTEHKFDYAAIAEKVLARRDPAKGAEATP